MKLNNRFIFGIVSIVLAAVIAFIALPTIARQTNGTTEIVRIVQPVQRGTVITGRDIEIIEVGAHNLPANIARTEDDVVGRFAAADLFIGDYILTSKVSYAPVSADILLSSIPSGKVAISLTVRTLASGLSDKLLSGDIVRIYHFLNESRDIAELHFVRVLAVTDSKGVDVDYSLSLSEDEEKRQTATITILASPEQARIITALENDGIAHVALISRDNERLAEELLEMQEAILYEIYFHVAEDPEDGDISHDAMPEPELGMGTSADAADSGEIHAEG
jgi:pilus assembly protein CpaB